MSDYLVEEFEHDGIKVRIYQDADPVNPRKEFDHVGTMVCAHRDYDLGDEQVMKNPYTDRYCDPFEHISNSKSITVVCSECKGEVENNTWGDWDHVDEDSTCKVEEIQPEFIEGVVILPLYLFDHSGLSMSTSSRWFRAMDSAGWDWGCVGFIYVTESHFKAEVGSNGSAWWQEYHAGKTWEEVAESILTAEVKEYDQYLRGDIYGYVVNPDSDNSDSCWGFYGEEEVTRQAKEVAEYMAKEIGEKLVHEFMD